jgi:acetyl esterase/lipase
MLILLLLWTGKGLAQSPVRYDVEVMHGLTYATRDAQPLLLDLYRPLMARGPLPWVVAVHGGAWLGGDREQMKPLGMLLAARGYAVVAMDYRLAPDHTFPAQLDDVRAAVAWVRGRAAHYRIAAGAVSAIGFSAGAQLAALLGVNPEPGTPEVRCVIAFFGPMDLTVPITSLQAELVLRAYLGCRQHECPARYAQASPVTFITPDDPPFLLLHGTNDTIVPFSQSELMREALRAANVSVTFVPMPEVGHAIPASNTPLGQQVEHQVLSFLHACAADVVCIPAQP